MKLYYCYSKVMNLWVIEFKGHDRKVASKKYWDDFMGKDHQHYELVPVDEEENNHVKN